MSAASNDDLLQQLREAASAGSPTAQHPAVSEFDWKSPNCFTLSQVRRLRELGQKTAGRLAVALSKLLRAEIATEPVQVNLRYGKAALESMAAAEPYYVAMTDDAAVACGCLMIPAAAATRLVEKFLGAGGEAPEAGRKLSTLEQELLLDVVRAIANEFSAELAASGGRGVKVGALGRQAPGGMEIAECGLFAMGSAGGDLPLLAVVLQCGFLEAVFAASGLSVQRIPPQENARRMAIHLQTAPVMAQVWLGGAELSMKDAMAVEVGDVLLLGTGVGQPVDVLVQGRKLAGGLVVKNDGRYAIQVTGRVDDGADKKAQGKV